MMKAVQNATKFGNVSLEEAVRMASFNPAKLLGVDEDAGSLAVGQRADLVAFDKQCHVSLTMVDGNIVYQQR